MTDRTSRRSWRADAWRWAPWPHAAAAFSATLLSVCVGCAALPFSARAEEEGPPRPGVLADATFDVRAATSIESYVLAPELNFLHPDRPRFHVWPIVARGRDLDSSQVSALAGLLDATRVGARGETGRHASFVPAYGLRFHGKGRTLDMLLSPDCARWYFLYGEEDAGEYAPRTSAAADSLHALMKALFAEP